MVPRHQVHQVSIDLKRKNGKLWFLHEDIVTGSTYQNFYSSLLSIGSILLCSLLRVRLHLHYFLHIEAWDRGQHHFPTGKQRTEQM